MPTGEIWRAPSRCRAISSSPARPRSSASSLKSARTVACTPSSASFGARPRFTPPKSRPGRLGVGGWRSHGSPRCPLLPLVDGLGDARFASWLDRATTRRSEPLSAAGRTPRTPSSPASPGSSRRRSAGRDRTPLASPLARALAAGRRRRRRPRAASSSEMLRALASAGGRQEDDGGQSFRRRPCWHADSLLPQSRGVAGRARLPCRARPDRRRAAARRSRPPKPVRRRGGKDRRMTFRPQPARWFELVTTKAHLAAALGALALTGAVELELRAELRSRSPSARSG